MLLLLFFLPKKDNIFHARDYTLLHSDEHVCLCALSFSLSLSALYAFQALFSLPFSLTRTFSLSLSWPLTTPAGDSNVHVNVILPWDILANELWDKKDSYDGSPDIASPASVHDEVERVQRYHSTVAYRDVENVLEPWIMDRVHELGGSISAEHGIGQAKRGALSRVKPTAVMDLGRSIKQLLDPQGILNRGKLF